MALKLVKEDLQSIEQYYRQPGRSKLKWPFVFTTPVWLQSWWESFGHGYELFIRSVHQEGRVLGIAPLMLNKNGDEAYLVGSPDVCDYLDFITTGDSEDEKFLFQYLIEHLKEDGVKRMVLSAQRPDSAVFRSVLAPKQRTDNMRGLEVFFTREDQTFELNLASDWDSYLAGLKKKQRHEVRRKLRRLDEQTGSYAYRTIAEPGAVETFLPEFMDLFKQNPEKTDFLTDQMNSYFSTLVANTARVGLARFGLLETDGNTAAAVLYFDHNGSTYLYNSGHSSDYRHLSAGLLSKVLAIRNSIEEGKEKFDFLKGEEVYKSRLGGTEIPIYKVTLSIRCYD